MSTAVSSNYWQVLLELWSDPEAESFLQEQSISPIPNDGPVHLALEETEMLLDKAIAVQEDAFQAERLGAVALLARILHRLQQRPCDDEAGTALQPKCYSFMQGLEYIIAYVKDPIRGTAHESQAQLTGPVKDHLSWLQQLKEEPGTFKLGGQLQGSVA